MSASLQTGIHRSSQTSSNFGTFSSAPDLNLAEEEKLKSQEPAPKLSSTQLAVWIFLCVNGGPYGIEEAVKASSPLTLLVTLSVIPILWCFPTAMMASELSACMPESNGGMIEWARFAYVTSRASSNFGLL